MEETVKDLENKWENVQNKASKQLSPGTLHHRPFITFFMSSQPLINFNETFYLVILYDIFSIIACFRMPLNVLFFYF